MSIIWCGGEDVDFPRNGYVDNNTSLADSYQRTMLTSLNGVVSQPFTRQTSGWMSVVTNLNGSGGGAYGKWVGLYDFSAQKGIFLGNAAWTTLELWILSSGTWTLLANCAGALVGGASLNIVNMNIISLGASASIKVYTSTIGLAINYSGNLSGYSFTGYDSVYLLGGATSYYFVKTAQIIVADESTLNMRLVTLAPNATGSTQDWSGGAADINETTLADTSLISTDVADEHAQFGLTNLVSGSYQVKALRIAYRSVSDGGTLGLKVGIRSGGSNSLSVAAALNTYWENKQILYEVNPVTGVQFTTNEIDALQLAFQSETL